MALPAICFAVVLRKAASGEWVHAEGTHKVFRVPFLVQRIDAPPSDGLSATRTKRTQLKVIMNFAVWFSIVLEKRSAPKRLGTICTGEMLWMPLCAKSINTITLDRFVAASTLRGKQIEEISLTVWTAILLEEVSAVERVQALRADKVLHMPLFSKGSNAPIHYRLFTVSTTRTKHLLVATLAKSLSTLLKEQASAKRRFAVAAHKVLRMESFATGLNHLPKNRLFACVASAARKRRVDIR